MEHATQLLEEAGAAVAAQPAAAAPAGAAVARSLGAAASALTAHAATAGAQLEPLLPALQRQGERLLAQASPLLEKAAPLLEKVAPLLAQLPPLPPAVRQHVDAVAGAYRALPPAHADMAHVAVTTLVLCALGALLHPRWVGVMSRSRNVSTVHAVVVAALAVACLPELVPLLFDRSGAIWTYTSPTVRLPVAVTAGYIAFDTLLGAAVAGQLSVGMWVHHGVVLACYAVGTAHGLAAPYHALFLINEASSPFLNWHFQCAGKRGGCVRAANGSLLWATYLVFRIVANTFLTWSVVTTSSPAVRERFPVAWGVQMAVLLTLTGLNANWFYRITRGFLRAITGGRAAAHAVDEEELLAAQQRAGKAAAAAAAAAADSDEEDEGGAAGAGASARGTPARSQGAGQAPVPVLSPGRERTGPLRQRRSNAAPPS